MCEVSRTLGAVRSGLSGGSGSWAKASSAAPPSRPSVSSTASACSSTRPPRAALTRRAPGFMAVSRRSSSSGPAAGSAGRCRLTTSARASSSVRPARSAPGVSSTYGSWARIVMPNAAPQPASSRPILPNPITPRVPPASSGPNSLGHPPCATCWCEAAMPRAAARIRPKVYSATARELLPGAQTTRMPRARAAARSMVSTPAPCLAMTLSRRAASITSAVIRSMPTISASASVIHRRNSRAGRAVSSYGRDGPAPADSRICQGSGAWRAKVGVVMRVVARDGAVIRGTPDRSSSGSDVHR